MHTNVLPSGGGIGESRYASGSRIWMDRKAKHLNDAGLIKSGMRINVL